VFAYARLILKLKDLTDQDVKDARSVCQFLWTWKVLECSGKLPA